MSLTTLLVFLLILLWASYAFYKRLQRSRYCWPVGPYAVPIFGHNLHLAKNAPYYLSKWAKKYGRMFTIKIGNGINTLVINDAKLLRQMFGRMAAAGKVESFIVNIAYEGSNGISHSDKKVWQEHREFCMDTLKTFRVQGEKKVESVILSEIESLCSSLEKEMSENKGKVFLEDILSTAVGNIMLTVITGEKTDLVKKFAKVVNRASSSVGRTHYTEYDKAGENIRNFIKTCFKSHKKNADKYDDVVSAFVEHVRKMENIEDSSFHGESGYHHSVNSVTTLLTAAVMPTAYTIQFLIFYLSIHPNVQTKVQGEIDEQVGADRGPLLSDREKMPYTSAVIQETLRKSCVAPVGFFHRLTKPISFETCKLPKNMILIGNLYHMHHDKKVWGDPEDFRPERFVDESGLSEFLVSFSVGKRRCLGETLAVDLIFMIATNILQKFSFSPEETTEPELYSEPEVGFLLTPKHVAVEVVKRE